MSTSLAFALLCAVGGCSGSVSPATCKEACTHAAQAQAHCSSTTSPDPKCEPDCNQQLALAQQQHCDSEANDFLTCIAQSTLSCDAHGDLVISACDAAGTALDRCQHPPPAGCESIPYPGTGSIGCSSAGTASNMPGAPSTITCNSGGHTWASTCIQSSCSCTYDGKMACTCAPSDAGVSCCPGV